MELLLILRKIVIRLWKANLLSLEWQRPVIISPTERRKQRACWFNFQHGVNTVLISPRRWGNFVGAEGMSFDAI